MSLRVQLAVLQAALIVGIVYATDSFPEAVKRVWSRGDFIYAAPGAAVHLRRFELTSKAYQGIRTIVVLNESASEETASSLRNAEIVVQQDVACICGKNYIYRAAMVPFLAHEKTSGNYTWMLYGDDDTIFYFDNVASLLESYDPSLPYLISDDYYYGRSTGAEGTPYQDMRPPEEGHTFRRPSASPPRCLPCHWSDPEGLQSPKLGPPLSPGCPCTHDRACAAAPAVCLRHDWYPAFAYGGDGMIISRALMQALDRDLFEACVRWFMKKSGVSGGDHMFSRCVWEQGYGITDPGHLPEAKLRAFGPFLRLSHLLDKVNMCENGIQQTAHVVTFCEELFKHMLSTHVWEMRLHAADPEAWSQLDEDLTFVEAAISRHAALRGAAAANATSAALAMSAEPAIPAVDPSSVEPSPATSAPPLR